MGHLLDTLSLLPRLLAIVDLDKVREATKYVRTLPEEDKSVVQTWLVAEAMLAGLYYILLFLIVFLLGRRIIQAAVAAYREAQAQSV